MDRVNPPAGADQFDLWIAPGSTTRDYWRDLWHYRELLMVLAWRDIAVRYRQAIAGTAWALVQPLVSIIVLSLIFNRLAGLPSAPGTPYALLVAAGVLPWQFFSTALAQSSQSLVSNAGLVTKVYFPRAIVPLSAIAVSLIDLAIGGVIVAALMVWYGYAPTWRFLALPLLVLLAFGAVVGPALIASALTVRYRDVRFVIPFVLQIGLYVTPVGYSSAVLREKLGETGLLLVSLNPMTGVIEGFRWALLATEPPNAISLATSFAVGAILLAAGIAYFRRSEASFTDVI